MRLNFGDIFVSKMICIWLFFREKLFQPEPSDQRFLYSTLSRFKSCLTFSSVAYRLQTLFLGWNPLMTSSLKLPLKQYSVSIPFEASTKAGHPTFALLKESTILILKNQSSLRASRVPVLPRFMVL